MANLILRTLPGDVTWPSSGLSITVIPTIRVYHWSPPPGPNTFDTQVNPGSYRGITPINKILTYNVRKGTVTVRVFSPVLVPLPSPTDWYGNGSVTVLLPAPPVVGALSAFGIWPSGAYDPEDRYIEYASQNYSQGGSPEAAWTRHSAIFALGRGLNEAEFEKVAFIGVGGVVGALPAGENHYFKMFQLEAAPTSGDLSDFPTDYTPARQVQSLVYPDRLNFSENPAFQNDTTSWFTPGEIDRVADGDGWAGQVAVSDSTPYLQHIITSLQPGQEYTLSAYVNGDALNDVGFSIVGGTLLTSVGMAASTDSVPPAGVAREITYRRVWASFVADATSVAVQFSPMGASGTLTVTAVVVERGTPLSSPAIPAYFDGSSGDDYMWEVGGTAGDSRSYYYQNLTERLVALQRVLLDNIPMGVGLATPQVGVLPVEWDTIDMYGTYGEGLYGGGIYGG